MRRGAAIAAALLALSGCGAPSVEISGALADGERAESVWHFGGHAGAEIVDDTFRLGTVSGDRIDLRFVDGDDLHARMEIGDAPGGAIHLVGIWIDGGAAHAAGVRMEGAGVVTVNGVRMMDPRRIPGRIDAEGVVLSASRSGDALLLRPHDSGLADLRVVLTPATAVTSVDGDPVEPDEVEPGDTLTVRGRTTDGYVVAAEVVVPRG